MVKRNIVRIDEEKCNGCGDCVTACAEGAIQIIDGKARLISDIYCDGLGACLGHCPMDAITVEQREAEEFDEKAVEEHLARQKTQAEPAKKPQPAPAGGAGGFTCPGKMARSLVPKPADAAAGDVSSQLAQWPVQLHLVSPMAPYFQNADLLLTADCVPFAMGDFHSRLLKGKAIAIACPKLDDTTPYVDKLAKIIEASSLNSLTVVHMEVPCCSGMTRLAQKAIEQTGIDIPFEDITVNLQGEIKSRQTLRPLQPAD